MQDLFIKICGITNLRDAEQSVSLGANAIGFIFYEHSPRYVLPSRAAEIAAAMPEYISKVGVFVEASRAQILQTARRVNLSAVQLSGREGPDDLIDYETSVIKVFHVHPEFDTAVMNNYLVDAFLLDTFRDGSFGGTGMTFDWNVAVKAKQFGRVILSGGLTPENIEAAVRYVRPYGVDVSSGVESRAGKKDHAKLRDFIANARNAQLSVGTPDE